MKIGKKVCGGMAARSFSFCLFGRKAFAISISNYHIFFKDALNYRIVITYNKLLSFNKINYNSSK